MVSVMSCSTRNFPIAVPNSASPRRSAPPSWPRWMSTSTSSCHSSQRASARQTRTSQKKRNFSKHAKIRNYRVGVCLVHSLGSNFLFSQLYSFLKAPELLKSQTSKKHAPEGPINSLVQGQLGRLNAPNGTLHKFIAKEIAMNTADDDPSLIRQKILRHAHAVSFNKC